MRLDRGQADDQKCEIDFDLDYSQHVHKQSLYQTLDWFPSAEINPTYVKPTQKQLSLHEQSSDSCITWGLATTNEYRDYIQLCVVCVVLFIMATIHPFLDINIPMGTLM